MVQLILNLVWKQIYVEYQMIYLDNIFQEDILKDQLYGALKELKTKLSNEKGSEKFVLQNEKVFDIIKNNMPFGLC